MDEYIERDVVLKHKTLIPGFVGEYVSADRIKETPAADVVKMEPELRKAAKMLNKEYAKAKQNPVVRDPLAYALYQTWRFFDDRKNGR